MISKFMTALFVLALLAGCAGRDLPPTKVTAPAAAEATAPVAPSEAAWTTATASATDTAVPLTTTRPTAIPLTPTPAAMGPDEYPEGVNPLTGLPVHDPETLKLPPALVSVTNSPIGARPQMGLSEAAWVFEIWIGEGVTRFLSVFYGDMPERGLNSDEPAIGPIRSGRLPYELLRRQYNGFMVMTYAASIVLPKLNFYHNVINESQMKDINGAKVDVAELRNMAAEFGVTLGEPRLPGLRFDPRPPAGGAPASKIWMPWSFNSQVWWRYDQAAGVYRRWQDEENGGQTFVEATDRLTGAALGPSNVVVLFAEHTQVLDRVFEINLSNITKGRALVFRDGQVYQAFWTTANGDYERKTGKLRPVRLMDAQGEPFPLKPGQTWAAIVTNGTGVYEAPDTTDFHRLATQQQPGSGLWVIHFYPPAPPDD